MADYRIVSDPALAERRGLFVAEGRLVVRRLLTASRLPARSALVTETAFRSLCDVFELHPGLPVYVVAQDTMNDIAGFNIHRGCLALGERPPRCDWRTLAAAARTLVVLERVGDADNVGSVFRNASAFGADAVLLGPSCADPLYRKAIRTSMGAALALPFADVQPWPDGLRELGGSSFVVIGLTPSAALPLATAVAAAAGRPAAVVLGHEGEGLTAEALDACELRARIPMAEGADSLNVAAAAAVALYELARR